MDGGAMLGAPLLFALELTILYAAGSSAMGRLMRISGFDGGVAGSYGLLPPGVSWGGPSRRRPLSGMPAHWNQGLPLRTILAWQIKRRSPRAWLRPSRTARLPHRSDYRAGTDTLEPFGTACRHSIAHAPHISRGRQPICEGPCRSSLRERVSDAYSTAGRHLGVPVFELRAWKRAKPGRSIESACAATGLWRLCPPGWPSKVRL